MGRAYTHVVKFNGGVMVDEIGPLPDRVLFAAPLRRLDGRERWGLGLFPVPEDTTYDEMPAAGREFTSYLQAGGSADALTVEIRKSVGGQGDFQESAMSSGILRSRVHPLTSRSRCRTAR